MASRELTLDPQLEAIRPNRSRAKNVNVGSVERWVTGVGGASLALLGLRRRSPATLAAAALGGALVERAVSGHCPAYAAIGVSTSDQPRTLPVSHAVMVNRDRTEVYTLWRDLGNLARFMTHVESVTFAPNDDRTSHWVARFPGLPRLEWDAVITEDRPGERLAWRSLPGSRIQHAGTVRFQDLPAGRGTGVEVWLEYEAPLGPAGAAVARMIRGLTSRRIARDIRRFKSLAEAGEIPTAGAAS